MQQNKGDTINISRTGLIVGLILAATFGGLLVGLILPSNNTAPVPPRETLPEPAAIIEKPAKSLKQKPVAKKPAQKQAPIEKKDNAFVIKGLISTAGEPWASKLIRVKLLWLKNKDKQEFKIGHENARVQMTQQGLAYRFRLKPQPNAFVNFNGGVEGNIARIIVFVDQQQDGELTPKKDKIIAVSKELLRYRTGRYDKNVLNDIQQQNILTAGKGYVFIRNEPDNEGKMDWRVVADTSPVRLDLSAAETSLPGMYNTFLKLQ